VSSLTPDEQVLLDGYRSLEPTMKKRMLAFMLGGGEPIEAAQTQKQKQKAKKIVVTSHGGQAVGGNLIQK
jgi:hypothetical protein